MTTKRRRERENEPDISMKRQRRRKRSSSEPVLLHDPINEEKRQVLKRLFGRNCQTTFDGEATSSASEASRGNAAEPGPNVGPETFNEGEFPKKDDPHIEKEQHGNGNEYPDDAYYNSEQENADPLLDSVPVDLDPEQLGFLVCAQETLRFLNGRGFAFEHPVFTRLRSRLLRGMDELAVA